MTKPAKRQTPYHGTSPDLCHFRFVRKSDCQPWHFPSERPPLAPQGDTLFDRFLAVLTIIGFVVFLFWALGQGV